MEEQVLNEILKDTYTLESFKKRALALKLKIEKDVFKSSDESGTRGKILPVWAQNFDKKILDQVNPDNFSRIFKSLNTFISEATILTIYFVFIPDEMQVKEIGEWLRESLKSPKLIYGVRTDPNLIGGCAIAYKGVYKDYSLKAKISKNREQLMEEFRRYLRQ